MSFDGTSIVDMDSPAVVMHTLLEIERELAERQNGFERAARAHHTAQRELRRIHATALLQSGRATATEKRAEAELAAAIADGGQYEAEYEASKAVIQMLTTRATINMSVLKSHGRA